MSLAVGATRRGRDRYLWQYLSYLVGQGHHHIVLDLRGMILIDSAGVQILARVSAWTPARAAISSSGR